MTMTLKSMPIALGPLLCSCLTLSACTGESPGETGDTSTSDDSTSDSVTQSATDDATGDSDGDSDSTTGSTTDSATDSTGSTSEGGDLFPGCERGVFEEDLVVIDTMGMPGPVRWYGPGVDQETGELLDDGVTTYHVSTTYLAMQTSEGAQSAFTSVIFDVNQALFSNPGMVAAQITNSQACNSARTFTVWTDEAAMMEFVTSDAHIAAITKIGEISRGGSAVTSWAGVPASDIVWESALAELAAIDPAY